MAQPAQRPGPGGERPHGTAARHSRGRLPRPANDNRRRGHTVPLYGVALAGVLLAAGLALLLT